MKRENIEILKKGGVGVIPTDTIYGLVGSALKSETVKRISQIKNRTDGKGFIVLISSINDLEKFGITLSAEMESFLNRYWPGKVSVELFYDNPEFSYLRRREGCNAFRVPDKDELRKALEKTGPLVAPSANLEGQLPAKNITEAKKYFSDQVNFYEDAGDLESLPSTLVRINGDQVEILRQGAVKIN